MPIGDYKICEEDELESVFPLYITFAALKYGSIDGRGIALMHKSMAQLKSYITGRFEDDKGLMNREVKVFEVVKGKPHLLYHLPHESKKIDSDLWKKKPKDRAVVVDEDDLAAALESIQRSMA